MSSYQAKKEKHYFVDSLTLTQSSEAQQTYSFLSINESDLFSVRHASSVSVPLGVVMQCHSEEWHRTGREAKLALALKQYSVSWSI